jgi:lysozyme
MTVQDLIAKHEGSMPNIYKDTMGIPTIGIGHNLNASPLPAGMTPPLTQAQISQLFQGDLNNVLKDLNNNIPWFSNLDPVRQAVVIDMAFNMGWPTLSKFVNTLGMIKAGNYTGAAAGMLQSAWAKQVPNRAKEDSKMMSSGLWPDDPNFPA